MIKRSFIGLTGPRLEYDLVEPDPKEPEVIPMPPSLVLLVNESLDSTRECLIKQGDKVKKGDRLSLYTESTEDTLSPISGTITSIDSTIGDFGTLFTYITVEKDQSNETATDFSEFADAPDLESANRFLRSLPGDLPLQSFLDPKKPISTLVIEGTDADLMSTTRQFVLTSSMEELKQGIKILKQMTGISNIMVTVPDRIKNLSGFEGAQTAMVSAVYPSALPQMILKDNLNIVIPPGNTPEDTGVCFMSVEAVVSLAKAYQAKQPVFDKVITVIGKDGTQRRITATIGTQLQTIFNQFDLPAEEEDRIIIGGPMRGFAAYSLYQPVRPDTDTIIIQDKGEIPVISDYPCINCGKCVNACPANVPVNLLVRFLEVGQYEEAADAYDLDSCIDCGLCSYVCTARIPLFQYIRLGKFEMAKLKTDMETEAANA